MSVGVSPLTDGVPGRAWKCGWLGGLAATGYVAKYPSNEWFSWKITTRCLIGVVGFGPAGCETARPPAVSRSTPRHAARPMRHAEPFTLPVLLCTRASETRRPGAQSAAGDTAAAASARSAYFASVRAAGAAGHPPSSMA